MSSYHQEPQQQLYEYFFAIPLSTFRDRDKDHILVSSSSTTSSSSSSLYHYAPFPYGMIISAISILFFRTTIYWKREANLLRWFFGCMLAFLTYSDKSYELICAVEVFSYMVPLALYYDATTTTTNTNKSNSLPSVSFLNGMVHDSKMVRIGLIATSAIICLVVCHLIFGTGLFSLVSVMTPSFVRDGLAVLFPIQEILEAYNIIDEFVMEDGLLQDQVARLFFITFHIQVAIGYIGIDFLKREQERRNQLVRMDLGNTSSDGNGDNDDENSHAGGASSTATTTSINKTGNGMTTITSNAKNGNKHHQKQQQEIIMKQRSINFQRTAAPFIFFTAVPYMIKVIAFGNLNAFAYVCFQDDVHRAIRLYDLFDHDNHLVALAEHSAKAPADFAGYMDTIVGTTYDLFNRKLFSLPKVLLLPMVMAKQPKMIAQIFPIIFLTDWLKGRAVSYMTNRIEQLQKEIQELNAIRSKVEQFDMKNAELLQRAGPGATNFTRRRWQDLTVKVQMKSVVSTLTSRTKGFFAFIQRNFVFSVLVDCALAQLMAMGKLVSADIFVFSRAIEDAVDMVLMRSRSEAELARMMTQIENLRELSQVWNTAKQRNLLPCNVAAPAVTEHAVDFHASLVVVRNLLYSRGTAVVRIDHMELPAGIYALTGANGSGKSTLFRLLMSCNSNDRPIDLPPSIVLSTPMDSLIEEDDIQREVCCEAADEAVEMIAPSDATNDETDSRNLSAENKGDNQEAHPRLSITMPSSHVVEISQTFYWPLYAKPIDWIYQKHISETSTEKELEERTRRVAELLHGLEFTQRLESSEVTEDEEECAVSDNTTWRKLTVDESEVGTAGTKVTSAPAGDAVAGIIGELLEEKEDWFNDLSGGQKSKVELVRKVFLMDECPHVLLIDETMAPLDPRSKALVMAQIKSFCAASVVIVIYHTDVGREQESEEGNGELVECVPSNDFFDGNIHVENKTMRLRPVC